MADDLSMAELARRTGEPVEQLQSWQSLGLIGSDTASGFGAEDVERVRLVQLLLQRGIALEAVARAEKERRFLSDNVRTMFPEGVPPLRSFQEAADLVGLPSDVLRRIWDAAGFGEQGETVNEEDVEMMRVLKVTLEVGFPEEALIQMVRVYADALGRVAEAESRLFHFYVHERLRTAGVSGTQLLEQTNAAQSRLAPLVEPGVLYFHRKGLARAIREDAALHLAEEAGLLPRGEVPGQLRTAIVFVDLSSFTPLADTMGDLTAVDVLGRFSELVRGAVGRRGGRVVKQIGDAFMLVFPDARSAVGAAVEIEVRATEKPQFPGLRSGVHLGPVLYREGDYVGSNVNIASRLAAEAQRHQILVTAAVRNAAIGMPEVDFVPLGKRRVKGLADDVEIFAAQRRGVEGGERLVDPVCGMELSPSEVAARLSLEGRELSFCSEDCLRRFVVAPERYAG